MAHKFDPKNLSKLDNEWRREHFPPVEMLRTLGLTESDILADIGCGIGYFTIPAAQHIIKNQPIYALDTSKEMLEALKIREQEVGSNTGNLQTVLTEEYALKLPDDTATFALVVNVLHEIDDKLLFLSKINALIKTDGKIAVVEWVKNPTQSGPPLDHRLSVEDTSKLLSESGFEIFEKHDLTELFYAIVAKKIAV